MALATQADVERALGRFLAEGEDVETLIEEASDLVAGYLRHEPNPVPAAVSRAVATMVVAVLTKPATTTADYKAGGYNSYREAAVLNVGTESATTTGPWLTRSIKQRLSRFRQLDSIYMTSERAVAQLSTEPTVEGSTDEN